MDRDEIIDDLINHYSKSTLLTLHSFMGINDVERLNKFELTESTVNNLRDKDLFSKLYNKLSSSAKLVVKHLTWDGISTIKYMDSKYHIKLSLEDFYDNTADPFLKHFKKYYSKDILFSNGLRALFKKHIDGDFPILESNDFKESNIIYTDNIVIDNLFGILEFIKSNDIVSRDLKKKLLIKTLNKFSNLYKIEDPLNNLRKEILLRFLCYVDVKDNSIETLTVLLKSYLNGRLLEVENIDERLFFPFIKGLNTNHTIDIFLKRGRYSFLNRIRSLNGWISVDALVREQSLLEDTQIFDTTYFGSILNVKLTDEFQREYSNKIDLIQKVDNENLLLKPMCRGIVFFLYSIGGADIVLDKNNSEYGLSPLEAITHFKITQLGRKLFGLKSTYKKNSKAESRVIFHNKKNIVTLIGSDKGVESFFKNISKPIGGGHFLISFESFFNPIESENEVDYYIDRLTELLGKAPSRNWVEFLSGISDRINPTYNEQELIVINFPKDDSHFIDIIMDNERIRSLFLLVEGFKGAFTNKKYKEFKKCMKEKGYIIN